MLQRHRLNCFIPSEKGRTDPALDSLTLPVGMASHNVPGLPTDSSPERFYSSTPLNFGQEGKIRESPLSLTNEAIPPIWRSEKLVPKAKTSRRKWKKPKDKPKRPLSAYNIFFQYERLNMMKPIADDSSNLTLRDEKLDSTTETAAATKTEGKGGSGFAGLTRQIAAKWNSLDPETRSIYEIEAKKEQVRYAKALDDWKLKKSKERIEEEELKLKAALFASNERNVDYDLGQHDAEHDNFHAASIYPLAEQETPEFASPDQRNLNDHAAPRFHPLHYQYAEHDAEHDAGHDWFPSRFATQQMNPSYLPPTLDSFYGAAYLSDSIYEPADWTPTQRYTHSESLSLLFEELDEDEQGLLLKLR